MRKDVQDYYGKTLSQSSDLQTDACCTMEAPPTYIADIMKKLHPETAARYYGCGLVVPELLEGLSILDLGCGAGRDVYLLSALVGAQGRVVGVDMTPEQLTIARKHIDYHTEQYGFDNPNVEFHQGYIEQLDQLGFDDNSFDLVISNCVINLSTDKAAVLRAVKRLLKPGGEMYFSDVYADRRMTQALIDNPVLYGECLSGALYWRDFIALAHQCGFADPRLVENRRLAIDNPEISSLLGDAVFQSATFRLFNIDRLEKSAEDYGQYATYNGGIPQQETTLTFDGDNTFVAGCKQAVSRNTWQTLQASRLSRWFSLHSASESAKYDTEESIKNTSEKNDAQQHRGAFCTDTMHTRLNTPPNSPDDIAKNRCC